MKTLQKISSLASCVLLALPLLAQTGKPAQSKPAIKMTEATAIILRGGKLLTISHGVIENGAVVIEGGKITAVGAAASVAVPKNARVIDTTGMTIYPGLIDSHTHLGLTEISAVEMTNDLVEASDEIMPHMHVSEAFHAE
jgi:imidazolonepropionase-like amidohydrolase